MSNDIELDESQPTSEISSGPTNSRLIIIGIAGMILGAFTCPGFVLVGALLSTPVGLKIVNLWFTPFEDVICFAPILGFVVSAILAVVFGKMVYAASENKSLAYVVAFAITVIYGCSPCSGVSSLIVFLLIMVLSFS